MIDNFFGGQEEKQSKSEEINYKEGSTQDNKDENIDDFFGPDDRQSYSLEDDFGSGDKKSSEEFDGSGGGDVGSGNKEESEEEEQSREKAGGGGIIIISRPVDSPGNTDENIVNVESCQGAKRQEPCSKNDNLIRTINGECNNLRHRYTI